MKAETACKRSSPPNHQDCSRSDPTMQIRVSLFSNLRQQMAILPLMSTLTNNSPEVGSPAISVQGSCDDSGPEQVEAGPTIHGSLDELELVDLAFYRSGAPGRGQCSAHRINVAPEAASE